MMDEIIEPAIYTSRNMEEYLHQSYWRVVLSDDRVVYSRANARSWLQLKAWLKENPSIYINGLWFGFRDHCEEIHVGKADYFFVMQYVAEYGGVEQFFYIGGFREGETVICKKFRIPEVYFVEEQRRSLDDPSVVKGLIRNATI